MGITYQELHDLADQGKRVSISAVDLLRLLFDQHIDVKEAVVKRTEKVN